MFGWFKSQSDKGARTEPLSPEVEAIFRKIDRLMNDEKLQNERLPDLLRSELNRGASCDELAGGSGDFGRDPLNPIPVNGPIGELIYLSNVRTNDSQPILFHRIGSIANVDVFETVSFDGSKWDILFLDFYHPRKSRRAPAGYQLSARKGGQLFFGTNQLVKDFPDQLPNAIADAFERVIGVRMRPPQIRELVEKISFSRPIAHEAAIKSVLEVARTRTSPKPQADIPNTKHREIGPEEAIERFSSLVERPLVLQLTPKFTSLNEAFGSVMTNKKAAGYIFGFHDALAQRLDLVDSSSPALGFELIKSSYKKLFGEQAGFALFDMSVHFQTDSDFHKGRLIGGSELSQLIDERTPPMGLNRILIFHLDC